MNPSFWSISFQLQNHHIQIKRFLFWMTNFNHYFIKMQWHNFDKNKKSDNFHSLRNFGSSPPHFKSHRISPSSNHLSNCTLIMIVVCSSRNVSLQTYLLDHRDLSSFWSFFQPCSLQLFQAVLFNASTGFPCTGQKALLCISLSFLTTSA